MALGPLTAAQHAWAITTANPPTARNGPKATVACPAPGSFLKRCWPTKPAANGEHAKATSEPSGDNAPAPRATSEAIRASPKPRPRGLTALHAPKEQAAMAAHAAPCHKWRQSPVPKLPRASREIAATTAARTSLVGTTRLSRSIKARTTRASAQTASDKRAKTGRACGPRAGTLATTAPVARAAAKAQRAHESRPGGGWPSGRWLVAGWLAPRAAAVQPAIVALVRQYQPPTPAAHAETAMTVVCMELRSPPFCLVPARDIAEVQKILRNASPPATARVEGRGPARNLGAQNVPGLIAAATTTNLAPDCFGPELISARRYPVPTSGHITTMFLSRPGALHPFYQPNYGFSPST